jgi:hypothetical protein
MVKESRRKVKPKSSPTKYVSSNEEIDSSDMSKNPKARINELLRQVGHRDEILEEQEKLLI